LGGATTARRVSWRWSASVSSCSTTTRHLTAM
jgi:hypothetical protein